MGITQSFHDKLASQYDKLFLHWNAATQEQSAIGCFEWLECSSDRTSPSAGTR